ncbi:cobalamin biosynthesis bifunctional protein CbiET [Corynebacterium sp. 13CS0277]|uniref:precorrin-6y C5,15-methyltransferase (decarboxylating) subunit CbiE n=1 Tax=Corynebacterium sp. 13CS0277 TaxID=2071994 RepID=UPI000D02AA0C|nr:precorrin-6y C5,15-methyltransferase (decarboxylating) subunit CbiE [Corynebacterium sp. 13CS0277]PRQ12053.1 cobalamin biosynthesis bifunctional protein CbiET [Corynebacterium sp. 13CS0277]
MAPAAPTPESSPAPTTARHSAGELLLDVIGLPAGGFSELGSSAQALIRDADVIMGSTRQLQLIPEEITARRVPYPRPLLPHLHEAIEALRGLTVVVLGSGDPMFHGIGTTLVREFGQRCVRVWPTASSASLACARLGWALNTTAVFSLVTQPVASLIPAIEQGQPFVVLGRDAHTPAEVFSLLEGMGFGDSSVWILSDLGSPAETIVRGTAAHPPEATSPLAVIAVAPRGAYRSVLPGLEDAAYDHDGQLTKQDIRAWTVCALAAHPGTRLWDIGGGSGSIAIETLRAVPQATATCFEQDPTRAGRIRHNAARLGTPRLHVAGAAPEAFAEEATRGGRPTAVFIGGGLTAEGVFDGAWEYLEPGGLLVANAVTLESEQHLRTLRWAYGGELRRIEIAREHAVGSFSTLRPALPVTQWRVRKPAD